jgi:hypothetical protein
MMKPNAPRRLLSGAAARASRRRRITAPCIKAYAGTGQTQAAQAKRRAKLTWRIPHPAKQDKHAHGAN